MFLHEKQTQRSSFIEEFTTVVMLKPKGIE
jgi:hypothetical protein